MRLRLYICMYFGPAVRVFANGPGDMGSIQVESYQRL